MRQYWIEFGLEAGIVVECIRDRIMEKQRRVLVDVGWGHLLQHSVVFHQLAVYLLWVGSEWQVLFVSGQCQIVPRLFGIISQQTARVVLFSKRKSKAVVKFSFRWRPVSGHLPQRCRARRRAP